MKVFLLSTIAFLSLAVTCSAQNTPWPTSGAVGIGTLTPAGIFQVQTASTDFLVTGNTFDIGLRGGTGGWARSFRVVNSSGSNGTDGGAFGVAGTGTTPGYAYMAIPTADPTGYNSTKILVLNNSGNVGIGTTAPSEKLHVVGGVRVGDGLSVSNISSGVLSLKLGDLNTTWNSTTDSFVGVQNTGGPGAGLAGDLLLIPRTSIDAGIRMLTGSSGTATERLSILGGTGNVGIGTTSPLANLQVQTNTNAPTFTSVVNNDPGASAKALISVGSTPGTGGTFGSFEYLGSGRTATGLLGADRTMLRGNGVGGLFVTAENAAGVIAFATGGTSSGNERVRIDASGNVGIGTRFPDQRLTVNGTVHSTSVLVDTNAPPPDYVFKKDYNLPTLAEIKTYTDKNHHLPGVPAAAEMEKNGINLGEMNMVLLKKVEELTLYLMEKDNAEIKQKEINEIHSAQLKLQQKQIDELKKSLDNVNHKKSK